MTSYLFIRPNLTYRLAKEHDPCYDLEIDAKAGAVWENKETITPKCFKLTEQEVKSLSLYYSSYYRTAEKILLQFIKEKGNNTPIKPAVYKKKRNMALNYREILQKARDKRRLNSIARSGGIT